MLPSAACRLVFVRFLKNASRPLLPAHSRTLRSTTSVRATEDREVFFQAFKDTAVFQKLAHHPEALSALEDFAKLLQEKGIDLSSGTPPSTFQMVKLASNVEFRQSAKRVGEELQKAGVDIQSKEIMQEMMMLMKLKNSS